MDVDPKVTELAETVRHALGAADLEAFAELLDPDVTWGAPGDPVPACRNRRQVLDWYARGRESGRRAQVVDVTANRDKILVSLKVSEPQAAGEPSEIDRWQVLTVRDGKVSDIRGYDRHDEAITAAGRSADSH